MSNARSPRPLRPFSSARGVAIAALVATEEGERANVVLPRLLAASSLDEKDRRFATELVYGGVRMCRACDWLVGLYTRGELEPVVRAAARAGAYQLAFMRVPSYAAVSATVAEAPERARSLLNAVLRRVASLVEAGPCAGRARHPPELPRLGGTAPGAGPGAGAGHGGPGDHEPGRHGLGAPRRLHPGPRQPGRGRARHLAGYRRASPRPVRRPRGESHLVWPALPLWWWPSTSTEQRAGVVRENAERLGLANLAVVVADGTRPPLRAGSFDAVLVDAPCSGLGVLRRRPDARWRVRPGDVARLARLQRRLLSSATPLVAPGGILAYSVCTLTRAETTEVGEWLVKQLGTSGGDQGPAGAAGRGSPCRSRPPWEPAGHGALLLPQAAGTDGMYMVALRRPLEDGGQPPPMG